MAIIQFRVDDDLKEEAVSIYSKLGLDLSTAIRMFLSRSVAVNGIPFPMVLDKETYDASKAIGIMENLQAKSKKNGNSNMSLEEINDEIKLARKANINNKKARK